MKDNPDARRAAAIAALGSAPRRRGSVTNKDSTPNNYFSPHRGNFSKAVTDINIQLVDSASTQFEQVTNTSNVDGKQLKGALKYHARSMVNNKNVHDIDFSPSQGVEL